MSSPAKLSASKAAVSTKAQGRNDPFHRIYKVPVGDSPYVRAKHVQLVDKDPEGAIALFWSAINAGDRVDSALKDMAIVMKQQDRPQEAIEAIISFRHCCSEQAQESLDNVLIDLYKKCGRLDEQIALLKHKLRLIQQGVAFNGKPTKTARSHGKKFQVSIQQETTRLLGNLGWAYMQQLNFGAAEAVYRKAQSIEEDGNKACNLGVCMMKQGKVEEAIAIFRGVISTYGNTDPKSLERARDLLKELQVSCMEADEMHCSPAASASPLLCEGAELAGPPPRQSGDSADDVALPRLNEESNSLWLESTDGNGGGLFGERTFEYWAGEMGRESARKRNRLRVFEEITLLKNEVAY